MSSDKVMAPQIRTRSTILYLGVAMVVGMIMILPAVVSNQFWLNALIMAHFSGAFVAGWAFLAGPCGQLSGGYALSLGGAAYASALASLLGGFGPWGGGLVGLVAALLTGLGVGVLSLRVRGPFLVLTTLALAEGVHEIAMVTGFMGPQGYAIGGEGGIPTIQVLSRGAAGFYNTAYYASAVLLILLVLSLDRLAKSRVGLMLRASGRDILSAEAVGVDTVRYRLLGFAVASVAAGAVGLFWGQFVGRVTPSLLSLEMSFGAIVLAVVGGKDTIIGPAVAGYAGTVISSWLWIEPYHQQLIYAAALLAAIRLRAQF